MFPSIAVIVFSCLASTSFDNFDPHRLNAAAYFVAGHPKICRVDPPLILEAGVSLQECQSRSMLGFMPGWMKEHPDRIWLGAKCELHQPQDVIMGAMPREDVRP